VADRDGIVAVKVPRGQGEVGPEKWAAVVALQGLDGAMFERLMEMMG
jgi:hypothetical protein